MTITPAIASTMAIMMTMMVGNTAKIGARSCPHLGQKIARSAAAVARTNLLPTILETVGIATAAAGAGLLIGKLGTR